MKDPIRFFVVKRDDGSVVVADEGLLAIVGLSTEVDRVNAFGPTAYWVDIWLREATFGRQQEIQRKCRTKNEDGALVYDPLRESAVRCEVMVERWNNFPEAPSETAFNNLPPVLANAIDQAILAAMYPSMVSDPNYLAAWKKTQDASARETDVP